MPAATQPRFYLRDGWTFSRESAGRVHIVKRDPAHDAAPIVVEITLTPEEWASVIASMSHVGETPESFTDAQYIHMGHFRTPMLPQEESAPPSDIVRIPVTVVKSDPSK
jgi:hypothetical protein